MSFCSMSIFINETNNLIIVQTGSACGRSRLFILIYGGLSTRVINDRNCSLFLYKIQLWAWINLETIHIFFL